MTDSLVPETTTLGRLKALSPDDRARIMELFDARPYSQVRPDVEKIVGFTCPLIALHRFFRWQTRENNFNDANDLVQQLGHQLPEPGRRRAIQGIVEAGLSSIMAAASAGAEVRILVAAARLHLAREQQTLRWQRMELAKRHARRADKHLRLQRDKFQLARQKAIEIGIDALLQEFKTRPDLNDKFLQITEELTSRRIRPLTRGEEIEQEEQARAERADPPNSLT